MTKKILGRKNWDVAKSLYQNSSPEMRDLVQFFVDTACETTRDSKNPNDEGVTKIFIEVFCGGKWPGLEWKITGVVKKA